MQAAELPTINVNTSLHSQTRLLTMGQMAIQDSIFNVKVLLIKA